MDATPSTFVPTHPEAHDAQPVFGVRLPAEETSCGRPALAITVDGDGTLWLDVERDLDAFIDWLRNVA